VENIQMSKAWAFVKVAHQDKCKKVLMGPDVCQHRMVQLQIPLGVLRMKLQKGGTRLNVIRYPSYVKIPNLAKEVLLALGQLRASAYFAHLVGPVTVVRWIVQRVKAVNLQRSKVLPVVSRAVNSCINPFQHKKNAFNAAPLNVATVQESNALKHAQRRPKCYRQVAPLQYR
jgi:hypothetical protein